MRTVAGIRCGSVWGMTKEERTYLIARAEREIELAERSTSAKAVYVHYVIASEYLERAYGECNDAVHPGMVVATNPAARSPDL